MADSAIAGISDKHAARTVRCGAERTAQRRFGSERAVSALTLPAGGSRDGKEKAVVQAIDTVALRVGNQESASIVPGDIGRAQERRLEGQAARCGERLAVAGDRHHRPVRLNSANPSVAGVGDNESATRIEGDSARKAQTCGNCGAEITAEFGDTGARHCLYDVFSQVDAANPVIALVCNPDSAVDIDGQTCRVIEECLFWRAAVAAVPATISIVPFEVMRRTR
jgi:hypothetical protein